MALKQKAAAPLPFEAVIRIQELEKALKGIAEYAGKVEPGNPEQFGAMLHIIKRCAEGPFEPKGYGY